MPFIDSPGGVEIYYEEAGEGRPLVMLHGWSMTGRVWRFQQPLADDCRLIVPDLRGHGKSSTPAAGFSLNDLAGDIVALFERLDLADAVLLGWSLGAQVALAAFLPIRERLAGLALVGATPRFTVTDGYPHGLPATEPRGMGLRLKRDYSKTMGEFFRGMFAQGELDREQENRVAREIVMAGRLPEPAVAFAALDILSVADLREMLPAVDLPVLVIHGSADAICPAGAAHYLVGRIADARLVEFDGAGHAPFLSRPDEFNAIVRKFLREVYGRH
jgi:pimeloyl-ACP methyl ester esterase